MRRVYLRHVATPRSMDPQTSTPSELPQQAAQAVTDVVPIFLEPIWAFSLLVAALVVSLGIGYLARLPGLRQVRQWLLVTRVFIWTAVIFNMVFALFRTVTEYWVWLGVLVIGLMTLASISWLRNVAAGLAVAFEAHFHVGDLVRVGEVEGEIVEFGTRTVSLRAADGTLHQIPNEQFSRQSVIHLEANGEAACEIVVALPAGISPERAVKLAHQAAFLTPLASPRHRPEVFLDVAAGGGEGVELHIRGFAFDPAYREHFRSDVVARVHDMLRTERVARA